MFKIIIANNNDIFYNSLSNILLQNELNIELTKVPPNKLGKLICKIKPKDNVIILDSKTSVIFVKNILKNAIENVDTKKVNIIILVINSDSISNIKYEYHYHFFKTSNHTNLLDIVKLVSDSLKDCLEIEKSINDLLNSLGFTYYFKGTIYLKDAIQFAYIERNLLYDTKTLVKKVAKRHKIKNDRIVRSDMDRALNSMLTYIEKDKIYNIFGKHYDGRIISLKYFIDLCIRYLEEQRYCCLEN